MKADSPERAAVIAAGEAWRRASAARAALGGYVPLNHPGHPSRWNRERRQALGDAEAELTRTTVAVRLAMQALRDC